MISSIVKFSKSLSVKILVGIIILPFVFWGMGDIFSGGNQNIIASIDSKKVSTKEFVDYLNQLNLGDKERKDLKKTSLLENILSEYIGKEIIKLEIEKIGIILSDYSLKEIIINDKTFFKDDKFSRTEYEKFLIQNGITAPTFEKNISEQEKRRQLLTFLSRGIYMPDFLVQSAFIKENQIKDIKFIDLNEIYNNNKIDIDEIKKVFEENKDLFTQEYKSISFTELTPMNLTGQKEFDKNFFNKIEIIENDILDGNNLKKIATENNLKVLITDELDENRKNIKGVESQIIDLEVFKKIFLKKNINEPELIETKNKYYIAEVAKINKISGNLNDQNVTKAITSQIKFKNKVNNNMSLAKKISSGNFKKQDFENFAKKNNIAIKSKKLKNLKDKGPFNEEIIKRIFQLKDNDINLISDRKFEKNFLIQVEKTSYKKLDKSSPDYERYKSQAKVNLSNSIYFAYDRNINNKYEIEINNKAIDRLKNSF